MYKHENVSPAALVRNILFAPQAARKRWCSPPATAWKSMARQRSACQRMRLLNPYCKAARSVMAATLVGYRSTVTKLKSAYNICSELHPDSIRWSWARQKFLDKQKRLINLRALLVRLAPVFIGCFSGPFAWRSRSARTPKLLVGRCQLAPLRLIWLRKFSANLAAVKSWFWELVKRASAQHARSFPEVSTTCA